MLDLGINFNVEDGAKKAEKELKEWQKRWQALLESKPLTLDIEIKGGKEGGILSEKETKKIEKNAKSIHAQLKELREEYKNLQFGSSMDEDLIALIELFNELKEKAGLAGSTLDAASKKMKDDSSESLHRALKELSQAWRELSTEERQGAEGQEILNKFDQEMKAAGMYAGELRQVHKSMQEVGKAKGFKEALSEMSKAWDKLSSSERKGAEGRELIERYNEAMKSAEGYGRSLSQVAAHERNLTELDGLKQKLADLEQAWKSLSRNEQNSQAGQELSEEYRKAKENVKKIADSLEEAGGKQDRLQDSTKKTTKEFSQLKTYAANFLSIYGGIRFMKSLITITGELEMQRVSLNAMLQDAHRGAKIFSQIKELAVKSPFQIMDLVSYAKQLSAFSVPYEELYDTTKRLADVSAGLGVDMGRIILAFGQVRSAAVLRGQELRQFTEAGIPLIELLADKFSELNGEVVRTGEVFEMIYRRKVSFEMVRDIFTDMTEEGGKFYKMQEKQADTLKGMVKNLKDTYDIMVSEMGDSMGFLKDAVQGVKYLMVHHEKILNILIPTVAALGAYKASMIAIGATATIQRHITYFSALKKNIDAAAASQLAYKRASNMLNVASPWVALATAVMGAIVLITRLINQHKKLRKELESISATKFSETLYKRQDLDSLIERISNAEEGTQSYRDALSELLRKYKDVLPENISMASSLEDITKAAKDASVAIMEMAKHQAVEEGTEKIVESYKKQAEKIERDLRRMVETSALNDIPSDIIIQKGMDFVRENIEQYKNNNDAFIRSLQNYLKEDIGYTGDKFQSIVFSLEKYAKALNKVQNDVESYSKSQDAIFGTDTRLKDSLEKAGRDYRKELENINTHLVASEEDVLNAKNKALKAHLEAQLKLYEDAKLGNSEDAKAIRKQLQQDLMDWAKVVDGIVGKKGLLAREETDYTVLDYIKRVRDEYQNLMADEQVYAGLHDQQSKNTAAGLREQIALTKQVASALGFSLETMKETTQKGISELDRYLAAMTDRLDEYKTRFEIWQTLTTGQTAKAIGITPKMDFDVTFNDEPNIEKYLKKEFQDLASREGFKVNMDVDFKTAKLEDVIDLSRLGDDDKELIKAFKDMFSRIRDLAMDDQKGLDKLLDGYKGYTQSRLDIEEKYQKERQKLVETFDPDATGLQAIKDKEALDEIDRRKNEDIEALTDRFITPTTDFQEFIGSLVTKSLDELKNLLFDVENQLAYLADLPENASQRARLMAEAKALKESRDKLIEEMENKPSSAEDLYRQWVRVGTVLNRVGKSLRSISDDIGGATGEAIGLASDITTGVIEMVSSLETLAKNSTEAISATGEAAAKSLSAVEKASVILAIVSAAFSIARKIYNFTKKEVSEDTIKRYKDLADATNKVIDANARMLESLSGKAATAVHENTTDAINRHVEAIRRLGKETLAAGGSMFKRSLGVRQQRELKKYASDIEALGVSYNSLGRGLDGLFDLSIEQLKKLQGTNFWYALDGDVRGYLESIIEAGDTTVEQAEKLQKALTGIDLSDVIDSLDDFIASADRDFEKIAENFEQYMIQAMMHLVKSNYLIDSLGGWYDDLADMLEKGHLTSGETEAMRKRYEEIAKAGGEMFDSLLDLSGIELSKDTNLQGIAKGIASASEDSILLLAGYMDSLRFKLFPYIDRMEDEVFGTIGLIALNQAEHINHLRAIELNTQVTADTNTKILENLGKVISPEGTRGAYALTVNA